MANISLLNRCNLKCPYCFAHSYIADERDDIDIATFSELLDFVAPDGEVGIIGGEPLMHKDFDGIMELLRGDFRFSRVTVFTNGIYIDKHLSALNNPIVTLLINVNSRTDIGSGAFEQLERNIGVLKEGAFSCKVSLGINVYKENQDFSDLLYLLEKYSFKSVRVSVVIPKDKSMGGLAYFNNMKPTLLSLYKELIRLGVCPCYDCNAIPECVYEESEREILEKLPFANNFERDIFLGRRSVCSPVIDIYPDKTATRCFGCYHMARVKIEEFESLADLRNYFFKAIDAKLVHNLPGKMCADCYKNKVFGCFGGCLCYLEEEKYE